MFQSIFPPLCETSFLDLVSFSKYFSPVLIFSLTSLKSWWRPTHPLSTFLKWARRPLFGVRNKSHASMLFSRYCFVLYVFVWLENLMIYDTTSQQHYKLWPISLQLMYIISVSLHQCVPVCLTGDPLKSTCHSSGYGITLDGLTEFSFERCSKVKVCRLSHEHGQI